MILTNQEPDGEVAPQANEDAFVTFSRELKALLTRYGGIRTANIVVTCISDQRSATLDYVKGGDLRVFINEAPAHAWRL